MCLNNLKVQVQRLLKDWYRRVYLLFIVVGSGSWHSVIKKNKNSPCFTIRAPSHVMHFVINIYFYQCF